MEVGIEGPVEVEEVCVVVHKGDDDQIGLCRVWADGRVIEKDRVEIVVFGVILVQHCIGDVSSIG